MFYRGKIDKCFKCIFLDPLNQDLLRTITYESTGIKLGKIKYLNIEKNTTVKVKRMYLDALVESKDYKINYEVNTTNNLYVHAKSMNYSCLNYANEAKVSGKYSEEKYIIQINLSYGLKDELPIRCHTVNDGEKQFVKNFIIYEINMDYYMDFWYNRKKQENLEYIKKYKYFIMLGLNLKGLKELLKITNNDRKVEKFMRELKRVNSDPLIKSFISKEEEDIIIKNSIKDEIMKNGIKLGEKRGRKNGILETAKKMLKNKLSIETISKCTGLSTKEIKSICL